MFYKIAKRKKKSQFGVMAGPEDRWAKYVLLPGAATSAAATGAGVAGSYKAWRAKRAGKPLSPRWKKIVKFEKPVGRAALAIAIPVAAYKALQVYRRMRAGRAAEAAQRKQRKK